MKLKERVILTICGAVMMLAQYIVVREIGSTFFATEIVAALTTLAVLTGPSIAYAIVDRISSRVMLGWGIATYMTLLLLPTGVRFLVAIMTAHHLEWMAMLIVLSLCTICTSAFFALFLPRFAVDSADFRSMYLCELAGAIGALLLLPLTGIWTVLLGVFWFLMVIVIHLTFSNRKLTTSAIILTVAALWFYPQMDNSAACKYYQVYWHKVEPRVLDVVYSPYQRIEVVEDKEGRSLHLDGIPYYDSSDLKWFNFYIASVPAKLSLSKGKALVIGSGTLESTAFLRREGFHVTTVDIDKKVPELGLEYFNDINKLDAKDLNLVIADARRMIREIPDHYYDLIVLDVPAPYRLQTALLYTPTFFKQLSRTIKKGGTVSINTCSHDPTGAIASSITASALESFPDVVAVTGGSLGLTVLYCGESLPYDTEELIPLIRQKEGRGCNVFSKDSIKNLLRNAKPHSRDNLYALLLLSRHELPEFSQWKDK